ncbi:MAG: MATE family efflux transporter [Candidatus Gastranaerophilaceae bacterium]
MITDMTKGSPLKHILLFSVPLLIGNIFQQLYNIADIVIVGRTLGVEALAAVGAVSPLFFLVMFVVVGLTNGFAVVTGQKFGAKDFEGIRRSVVVSILLGTIFTLLFTIIAAVLMKPLLLWMNVPSEIFHNAYWYMAIVNAGLIVCCYYNLLASIIRALGDSKTPLYFLIFASILNIFLALLFIIKFIGCSALIAENRLGINRVLVCKKNFPFYLKKKIDFQKKRKQDIDFAVEHLKVGIPMGIQFSILGLVLIIQSVCNTFGPNVIAAFTAALRIEQIATLPMISFGIALAAYVAQNYGAKKFSRIRAGVSKTSLINIGLSLFMAFIMHMWGSDIVRIFIGDANEEIIKIARSYLLISTMFYFFLGQIFIFRNALQGMGQTLIPLSASTAELLVRSYAAVYLAVKYSYFGIFYAGPIAWVTASLVVAIGYFSRIRKIMKQAYKHV